MDNLQRAHASRRGGHSFMMKLLTKAQTITETYTDTTETVSIEDREGIDLILSQLSVKKRQLEELDAMIASALTTEKELEEEVGDAEMYHFTLTERLTSLRKFSNSPVLTKNQTVNPSHLEPSSNSISNIQSEIENTEQGSLEHTTSSGVVSNPLSHTHGVHNGGQSVGQFVSRLPKLTLPTFGGDPLQFQTFWDSFAAAVHNDNSLIGVQKFHYLRAQLLGDASNVIDNLPLTDANYQHSVAFLKVRFGQPYKLVNAHMDALMNLPKPVNNLVRSWENFLQTLENSSLETITVVNGPSRMSWLAFSRKFVSLK